jgi:hypothetical protein
MKKNIKSVLLKDLDSGKEVIAIGETWEELYDRIYFCSCNGNISTKESITGNVAPSPVVTKLSLEECGCGLSIVYCGKELASGLNEELATTLFTSLAVAQVMKKEKNE